MRFEGKTAQEWREMAAQCYRDRADSIERSDTDGFLSQWASSQMADRYLNCARVAEQGGLEMTAFISLHTKRVIKGRWIQGAYGATYLTEQGYWITPSRAINPQTRRVNEAKKGFQSIRVIVPARLDRKTYYVEHDHRSGKDWMVINSDYYPE